MTTPEVEVEATEVLDDRPQRRREWSGGLRSVVLPLLAVAAIVAAVWYLERGRGEGSSQGDGYGIVALESERNTTGRPAAADVGRAAPDFRLARLGGGDLRLSDLRGQVVVLNFWATWCGPCRSEMPEFVRLHSAFGTERLAIVAVDLQEAPGPVQNFVDEFGVTFPTLFDRTGEVARTYRVTGLPVTLVIDREGVIRAARYGEVSPEYIRGEVAKLL